MIRYLNKSIFDLTVDCIVNPVNCVGVMGKGLAKEYKIRYPNNYSYYRERCFKGELKIGKILVFDNTLVKNEENIKYIFNFPTKNHWKDSSKLEYIEEGLKDLVNNIYFLNIKSIAIPKLGCGLGGLNWRDVNPLIIKNLSELKEVDIICCV